MIAALLRLAKRARVAALHARISYLAERRDWFDQTADYNRREAACVTDKIARIRRELVALDVPGLAQPVRPLGHTNHAR